jgi:hypothetical protein
MKLNFFLWTLIPLTVLKLGFDLFGFYFLLEYNVEPFDLGIVSGSISLLFWSSLVGTIIFIIIKRNQLSKRNIYTTAILLIIILSIAIVDKTAVVESLHEEYFSNNVMMEDPADLTINDVAEIQVIDLLHLVQTQNKEVFSELIAYSGSDKVRSFKDHLDLSLERDEETNNLYFDEFRKIMDYCYELKPSTGNIDTEYNFVITDSRTIQKNNRQVVRVKMNFCLPNEVKCIEDVYYFDFVKSKEALLLIDINDMGLHK